MGTDEIVHRISVSKPVVIRRKRRYGRLSRWPSLTFQVLTDPELEAKIHDMVGLCLNPQDKAIVRLADKKS